MLLLVRDGPRDLTRVADPCGTLPLTCTLPQLGLDTGPQWHSHTNLGNGTTGTLNLSPRVSWVGGPVTEPIGAPWAGAGLYAPGAVPNRDSSDNPADPPELRQPLGHRVPVDPEPRRRSPDVSERRLRDRHRG